MKRAGSEIKYSGYQNFQHEGCSKNEKEGSPLKSRSGQVTRFLIFDFSDACFLLSYGKVGMHAQFIMTRDVAEQDVVPWLQRDG